MDAVENELRARVKDTLRVGVLMGEVRATVETLAAIALASVIYKLFAMEEPIGAGTIIVFLFLRACFGGWELMRAHEKLMKELN